MKLVFVPLKDVFKECKGKRQFSIKKDAYRRFSSVSNEMQIGIKKNAALYAGQFAFFTYIRPVYMNLAGFGVDGLTLVLLSFGIASFVGTSLSSFILKRSVKLALAGAPFVLALSALVLTLWGSDKIVATGVAIIWGLTFALIPVGWSTWITRSLADQAEKAGSIQVAVIQLANTCGAAIGGYALDNIGLTSPLMLSGTLMLLTALLVTAKVKMKKS